MFTGLLIGRFTRQERGPADVQTGPANIVDAPVNKSEWGQNARINSNDSTGRFVRRNCKQIDHFLIRLPTLPVDQPIPIYSPTLSADQLIPICWNKSSSQLLPCHVATQPRFFDLYFS